MESCGFNDKERNVLMIAVTEQKINEIPCLTVNRSDEQNQPLPTVVYYHGFTSAKEHNLPLAYLLAQKGIRVILPDSMYHGERTQGIDELDVQLSFWDIMIQNVAELKEITEHLVDDGLLLHRQIGVAGTSMGGITTGAALRKYSWIKTGAILMGSPKISEFAKELIKALPEKTKAQMSDEKINSTLAKLKDLDLSKQISSLNERPLFLWHGEADRIVPFDHTYTFYQKAKDYYKNKELIHFSREVNRDHKVSRPAILKTVDWFNKHLK